MFIHFARFIFIGIFSLSAISLLAYQGIEIAHSIADLFGKRS
ncbi:hypothetical protein [Aquibacillus kalidii]|nr:hypothetical protein [Aquibacillus kalidii]